MSLAPIGTVSIAIPWRARANIGWLRGSENFDLASVSGRNAIFGVLSARDRRDRVFIDAIDRVGILVARELDYDAASFTGRRILIPVVGGLVATEQRQDDAAIRLSVHIRKNIQYGTQRAKSATEISDRAVDIRLVQDPHFFPDGSGIIIDWQLRNDGTLDDTQALATAMIVALGTDHRANAGEPLPDPDNTDRRGWWGDYEADTIWDGWPIGSKLWLLKRDKITGPLAMQGSTLVRVENYIREAVQPFIQRRIGSQMFVEATRHGRDRIDALVRLYRGPVLEIELRYSVLWADIVTRGEEYDIGGMPRQI